MGGSEAMLCAAQLGAIIEHDVGWLSKQRGRAYVQCRITQTILMVLLRLLAHSLSEAIITLLPTVAHLPSSKHTALLETQNPAHNNCARSPLHIADTLQNRDRSSNTHYQPVDLSRTTSTSNGWTK